MKKIFMTMIAALAMTTAMAQGNDNNAQMPPKKPTPEEITERMAEQLSLTKEQKGKVLALNKEYSEVLGGPGMGEMRMRPHRQGPRPDGVTGATGQARPEGQRPPRPEMTDAQKEEMKKQMEKRKEYQEKLKQILTEEQMKSYQEMHRPHHRHNGHHDAGNTRR